MTANFLWNLTASDFSNETSPIKQRGSVFIAARVVLKPISTPRVLWRNDLRVFMAIFSAAVIEKEVTESTPRRRYVEPHEKI